MRVVVRRPAAPTRVLSETPRGCYRRGRHLMSFQGSLNELPLADIVQLVAVSGKTGMFSMTRASEQGYVYLQNGQITHAKVGDVEGEDAIYALALWNQGTFQFSPGVESDAHSITRSNTNLLIEAARRSDEWKILSRKIPATDSVPRPRRPRRHDRARHADAARVARRHEDGRPAVDRRHRARPRSSRPSTSRRRSTVSSRPSSSRSRRAAAPPRASPRSPRRPARRRCPPVTGQSVPNVSTHSGVFKAVSKGDEKRSLQILCTKVKQEAEVRGCGPRGHHHRAALPRRPRRDRPRTGARRRARSDPDARGGHRRAARSGGRPDVPREDESPPLTVSPFPRLPSGGRDGLDSIGNFPSSEHRFEASPRRNPGTHARSRRQRRFDETDADRTLPRRGRVFRALPPGVGRRSPPPSRAKPGCSRSRTRTRSRGPLLVRRCRGACGTRRRRPPRIVSRSPTTRSATTSNGSACTSATASRTGGRSSSRRARSATTPTTGPGRASSTAATVFGGFTHTETGQGPDRRRRSS